MVAATTVQTETSEPRDLWYWMRLRRIESYEQLAIRTRGYVSGSTINRIALGRTKRPRRGTCDEIAQALGVRVDQVKWP